MAHRQAFSEKELYDNCDDCVSRCKADFEKGKCGAEHGNSSGCPYLEDIKGWVG